MTLWYARLPLHAKLVVMALAVTTTASALAVVGTAAVDVLRYRATAIDDTRALAAVIAENVAAAVVFQDPQEASTILSAAGVRPTVRRACLYLPDQTLFARFERAGEACPLQPEVSSQWFSVSGSSVITRNQRDIGSIHVERELPELWTSIVVTAMTGFGMILLAAVVAIPIANRLQRRISEPIVQLANAVRDMGADTPHARLPSIDTGLGEIGQLVRAFSDMLRRVSEGNEALRRKEVEREELLQRERDANRLKDEFLAAVSHELRTPLNAIVGWVQILRRTSPSAEVTAKAIESIDRNARAQARVIEDLVDVSRIVTGKLNVRFDPVDLREVIAVAVDASRAAADVKTIALTMTVPAQSCFVNGDRDRLLQVLGNLLSNAIKFTPARGTISVAMDATGSGYQVTVTDNGIGIDPEFLPHVFDRFRQADGSITRQQGGLGLGLAIVKELISLHRGSVSAQSDGPGKGATFSIRIPSLIEGRDADRPVATPQVRALAGALSGIRILAVDDNPDALEVLAMFLRGAGAQVRTASSGEAALRLCDDELPDVMLCDLAMPDVDGFEVLRRARDRFERSGSMFSAIAVSAHATDEHRARSVRAGFKDHVAKPYQLDVLIEAVRRVWGSNAAADTPITSAAVHGSNRFEE